MNPPPHELPIIRIVCGEHATVIEPSEISSFLGSFESRVMKNPKRILLIDGNMIVAAVSDEDKYDPKVQKLFTAEELHNIFVILITGGPSLPRKLCVVRNNELAEKAKRLPPDNLTSALKKNQSRGGGSSGGNSNGYTAAIIASTSVG